jgi:hypothetical protein
LIAVVKGKFYNKAKPKKLQAGAADRQSATAALPPQMAVRVEARRW